MAEATRSSRGAALARPRRARAAEAAAASAPSVSHSTSSVPPDAAGIVEDSAGAASSRGIWDGFAARAADILFVADGQGRFLDVNGAGERAFGFTRAELAGMTLDDVTTPESRPRVAEWLRATAVAGRPGWCEFDIVCGDRRRMTLEASASPCLLGPEGMAAVQAIARDVTDHRRAQEALRHSEQRFRMLVEQSADGLLLVSPQGRIFFASKPVVRWLGYAPEEFLGRDLLDLTHPDDRDRLAWVLADAVDQPALTLHAAYRCRHRDGTWRLHEAVLVNHLHQPSVNALVVNFRDVTDARAAETALHESEQRFRAVFESALMGIARVSLDGRILDVNRALVDMSGLAKPELVGKPLAVIVHRDDASDAAQELELLASGRQSPSRAERRYVATGGRVFWAHVTGVLVKGEEGSPQFVLVMFENITERRQAEAELRDTNARLSVWVQELEQRTREIELLSDMGDLLQACRSPEEACQVIVPIAAKLFPESAGVVSVGDAASAVVDPLARWGVAPHLEPFGVADCWALRRGRAHVVVDREEGPLCRHLQTLEGSGAMCVPMMAHGELLGVLSLVVPEGSILTDPRQRLVTTVAEHVSLALANLKLEETLRSQSIRDPLTGLFNRRYMEESLEREMRRAVRNRTSVGIIMLDLDHFKAINDTHGHDAGDALLRQVGAVLQRSIRAEDIACRYGGEEFTLILPEASLPEAAQRADALRQAVRQLVVPHLRHTLPPVTISAGVAIYPDHGPTADVVIRAADTALYQAKVRGRDRVVLNQTGGLFPDSIVEFGRRP